MELRMDSNVEYSDGDVQKLIRLFGVNLSRRQLFSRILPVIAYHQYWYYLAVPSHE